MNGDRVIIILYCAAQTEAHRERVFEGLPPGVLIAEGIHKNASHRNGKGINTLIGSDQVPPFGGVAFHDATVWIRPALDLAVVGGLDPLTLAN